MLGLDLLVVEGARAGMGNGQMGGPAGEEQYYAQAREADPDDTARSAIERL